MNIRQYDIVKMRETLRRFVFRNVNIKVITAVIILFAVLFIGKLDCRYYFRVIAYVARV